MNPSLIWFKTDKTSFFFILLYKKKDINLGVINILTVGMKILDKEELFLNFTMFNNIRDLGFLINLEENGKESEF